MWRKAVFQPKVKLNIFFRLLTGICDSEIIPKLCWFRVKKKILWTLFYSSCPQLINASLFSPLPVHLSKFSFAVIILVFNSSTPQNSFAPERFQFLWWYVEEKARVRWEQWLGFRESPWSDVRVWGWEPFPSLLIDMKAAALGHKKSGKSTHVSTWCFSSLQLSLFSSRLSLG